jgi:hypothetical protein
LECNIKMDMCMGLGRHGDLINLALDRGQVAGCHECRNELPGSNKCRDFVTICETISLSKRSLLHGVSSIFM